MAFLGIVVVVLVLAGCVPKPSRQRVGVRVVDGQAEILVGLCDGEQIQSLQVRGPGDETAGEEDFVDWWVIERRDAAAGGSTQGQREQVITVGEVPEGFEETLALRTAVPESPEDVHVWLRMQTGTRASVQFDEPAFEGDGRWYVSETNDLFTTEELLAERTRVCPETADQ